MPGLTLTFFGLAAAAAHAAAAVAFGSYLCGNDDDPVHDSNYSRSSHNHRTTRTQTQPSHRPPPQHPSYTYQPAEPYSDRATPRTPAPTDVGRGVYPSDVVSPYTRTPSQTQQSSTRSQPSIAKSASTSSRVPSRVPTERDPLLSPVIRSVSRSNGFSPYTRTPSQTQPSSTRTQPSSTLTESSSTHAHRFRVTVQSASTSSRVPIEKVPLPRTVVNGVNNTSVASPYTRAPSQTQQSSTVVLLPSSTRSQLSSTVTRPSSTVTRPSPTVNRPSPTVTRPSPAVTQPSSSVIQSSSTLPQASHQQPSPIKTVHVHEPPEYEFSQARSQSHVPVCVHTTNEPPPPTVNQVISSDLCSGEPASVEDLDFAKKLREQARQRGRDMSDARSRAKSAQKNGRKGAAQEHRQNAIAHEKVMKELDKRAAKIIFTEKNKVCN
jgi:hypothetical protein